MPVIHSLWTLGSYLVPFIFVLSLVVFIHEFGHFLVGRWCGIKVDAFSMGFGPELLHYTDRKGTRWRLAALPLGGYVKFHGDANGASATDFDGIAAMSEEERAVSFAGQVVWKRAVTVAAGPIANFILALVIFTGLFYGQGREILTPRIDGVIDGGRAASAGFQKGDLVLAIEGQKIESFGEMQRVVTVNGDKPLKFTVLRQGHELELTATPERRDVKSPFGEERVGVLGVSAGGEFGGLAQENLQPAGRGRRGRTRDLVRDFAHRLLSRRPGCRPRIAAALSGPLRIAEVSGEVAKAGIWPLINLAAILSISIGLLNLLPVPLLDGGHLMYYAAEAVRGRALPPRAQEMGFRFGLAFVAGLMLIATYNDLARLTRQWLNLG